MSKAKHYLKQREYNVQSTVCAIFPEAFEPQDGEAVSLFSDSRFEKKKKKNRRTDFRREARHEIPKDTD